MFEACGALCIKKDDGDAIQSMDEAMCQRNCYTKYNVFRISYNLKDAPYEYYVRKQLEI